MKKKDRSRLLKQLDRKDFLSEIAGLWPAAGGSLSLVRKPCVRPVVRFVPKALNMPRIFNDKDEVGRRCMYVPKELAPVLREALENGKKVDKLMSRMAVRMIMKWRDKRGEKASK